MIVYRYSFGARSTLEPGARLVISASERAAASYSMESPRPTTDTEPGSPDSGAISTTSTPGVVIASTDASSTARTRSSPTLESA